MLGFVALCGPVAGRKRDAPEARSRLEELNGYFGIASLSSFNLNHPAHLLFFRDEVTDGEQLADMKRFSGNDQGTMHVDDDGIDSSENEWPLGRIPLTRTRMESRTR